MSAWGKNGNVQVNALFQQTNYPFNCDGNFDYRKLDSVGVGIGINHGTLLTGMMNIAVLLPYKYTEKIHPSDKFVPISENNNKLALDLLLGAGYTFDLSEIDFFVGGGFHMGTFFESYSILVSYGLGLEVRALMRFGNVFTLSVGVNGFMDFASTGAMANERSIYGFIWGMSTSFGMAFSY